MGNDSQANRKKYLVLLLTAILMGVHVRGFALEAGLTAEEKNMPEARYWNPEFKSLPAEVERALVAGPISCVQALKYEDINDLLKPGYLEDENGYCVNPDGTAFAAARTDFPGATGEMIRWWFWWHANEDLRYKIWCPGAHYAIGARGKRRMNDQALSYEQRFLDNPQYPVEDVGFGARRLYIRFVPPEEFGFDPARFEEAGIEAVLCGVVGDMFAGIPVRHTYMVHIFRKTDTGLELRSRFWIGKALCCPALRRKMITADMARNMVIHCATEYNHLAEFLPEVYTEFK